VVSGNVSFYNETKDKGIKPTPSIGGVGLIKNYKKMVTMDLKEVNNLVIVVGKTEGHLDQSIFARNILSEKNGPPPEINLFNEKNNGETILKLIEEGLIESAHDVSLGGIITALTKMCIRGKKGIKLNKLKTLINKFQYFFAEDQGRYIIEINKNNIKKVKEILNNNSVHYDELAIVIEKDIIIDKEPILTIDELMIANKKWLKEYMVQ
jgi:phosphoribosylformylglycinamidine synthase